MKSHVSAALMFLCIAAAGTLLYAQSTSKPAVAPPLFAKAIPRPVTVRTMPQTMAAKAVSPTVKTVSPLTPLPKAPPTTKPYVEPAIREPVPPPLAPPTKAQSGEDIAMSGTKMATKDTAAGSVTSLIGDAFIKYKDSTLVSSTLYWNDTTEIATAPGRVQIEDKQNTIVGDTGTAYYKTRDAAIKGNITIVMRPKPEDEKASEGTARREFKNPVTITCDLVQYNWRTRKAVLTGNLTFREANTTRVVTAEKAFYDGKNETLRLLGSVKYRRTEPKPQQLNGDEAFFILREGEEEYSITGSGGKKANGVFHVETDEEDGSVKSSDKPEPVKPNALPAPTPPSADGRP